MSTATKANGKQQRTRAAQGAAARGAPAGGLFTATRARAREAAVLETKKRPAHRPPYVGSDEHRRTVEAMTACGIDHERISLVVGIAPKTLRKHYRKELDSGLIKAVTQVAVSLFNKAKGGDVNAMKFYLSSRAPEQWGERLTVQQGGAVPDVRLLTDAELEARVAYLRRIPSVARALRKAANEA